MEANPTPMSLNWLEIWRMAFFHPTINTYSRIIRDPKVSFKWGIFWAGITAVVVWIFGPQRTLWWGLVADNFGLETAFNFVAIGSVAFPMIGVMVFLIVAAVSHGLAHLFNGAGYFKHLVFCWGVIQLPFILFAGIALYIPAQIYSIFRLLSSSNMNLSILTITTLLGVLIATAGALYLFFAQVAAFSAVEKFGLGKGLSILVLPAILFGAAIACLSVSLQTIVTKLLF